jgi:hypothetical protein
MLAGRWFHNFSIAVLMFGASFFIPYIEDFGVPLS